MELQHHQRFQSKNPNPHSTSNQSNTRRRRSKGNSIGCTCHRYTQATLSRSTASQSTACRHQSRCKCNRSTDRTCHRRKQSEPNWWPTRPEPVEWRKLQQHQRFQRKSPNPRSIAYQSNTCRRRSKGNSNRRTCHRCTRATLSRSTASQSNACRHRSKGNSNRRTCHRCKLSHVPCRTTKAMLPLLLQQLHQSSSWFKTNRI
jgi:hypothetical protein